MTDDQIRKFLADPGAIARVAEEVARCIAERRAQIWAEQKAVEQAAAIAKLTAWFGEQLAQMRADLAQIKAADDARKLAYLAAYRPRGLSNGHGRGDERGHGYAND